MAQILNAAKMFRDDATADSDDALRQRVADATGLDAHATAALHAHYAMPVVRNSEDGRLVGEWPKPRRGGGGSPPPTQ